MKIVAQTETGFLLSATATELADMGNAGRVDTRPLPAPAIGQTVDPLSRIQTLVERLTGTESALRHARMLQDEASSPRPEGTGKTALEIVDEVNELAGIVLRQSGYLVETQPTRYWNHANPRCQQAWAKAVEIYEHLFATEVHDALIEIGDAEDEAA